MPHCNATYRVIRDPLKTERPSMTTYLNHACALCIAFARVFKVSMRMRAYHASKANARGMLIIAVH